MPRTPATTRPGWFQLVAGVIVGALVAVVAFVAVGFVRDDPIEGIPTTYRLSDDDDLEPGPVSMVVVRDIRQPTSIPGLAAPTGDRHVSLVLAMERYDDGQRWLTLEDFTLSLVAIGGSGAREELIPADRSQRLLDGVGGRIRGSDPYWIRLEYEPPSGDVDGFEVDLGVDGEVYSFTVHPDEAA